jgi:hypothetical protein
MGSDGWAESRDAHVELDFPAEMGQIALSAD